MDPDLLQQTYASLVWLSAQLRMKNLNFDVQFYLEEHYNYHGVGPNITLEFPRSKVILERLLNGKENGTFWDWVPGWISWR